MIFKYTIFWRYRYLIHVLLSGVFSITLVLLPIDVVSKEPYIWLKLWGGFTFLCLLGFCSTLRVAKSVEIYDQEIKLNFNFLSSRTFRLKNLDVAENIKNGSNCNAYGVQELKLKTNEFEAYITLNMKEKEKFLAVEINGVRIFDFPNKE